MTKPYTPIDLVEHITADRTWRLREISDLKDAVQRADDQLRRVLLRALVTVCYAHWEGYVRSVARKYLQHISLRKLPYRELDQQFRRNYFLPQLAVHAAQTKSLASRCLLVDHILASDDSCFVRVNDDLVNTRSNLSSEVFRDICLVCAIPEDLFSDSWSFIDVFLLRRRNAIAHGEDTMVGIDDLDMLVEHTISLMRQFGTELENRAVLKRYRAAV